MTAPASSRRALVRLDAVVDARLAGGKAWNLARLRRLGVPVPDGHVIPTTVFDRFLDPGLRHQIDALLAHRDAASVRKLVHCSPLPPDLDDALDDLANTSPRGMLAVRSSAGGEDGGRASFAGQLDTVLDVLSNDRHALREAIRTCWSSYWSDRSLHYRATRGADLDGMAVVVQCQAASVASGVLFTRDPMSPANGAGAGAMLVEWVAGLGEGLVSGRLDPARVRIDRETLAITDEQHLPETRGSERAARAITTATVRELCLLALRIERELGAPQDIEWTVDEDDRLWILQSRPITTPAGPGPSPTSSTRDVLWSNANVSENFPDPISPLLYSIASTGYAHYFRNLGLAFGISRRRLAAMDRPLRHLIGVHAGRMYYNLTNIHAVLRMAPCGEALAGAFNQFTGATELARTPDDARTWRRERNTARQVAEIARIAACTTWQYLWLGRRVRAFERAADRFAADTSPATLATLPLDGLLSRFAEFMAIRCHRWKSASLADTAAMVSYAMLQRGLTGAGAPPAIHNRLLRALPGVPSSQPALRLWSLSRAIRADDRLAQVFATLPADAVLRAIDQEPAFAAFRRDFRRYLEDWGFRSSSELMLTVPSLAEQPEPVIEILRQYAQNDGEAPAAAMARQAAKRRAETRALLGRLVWRRPLRALAVWRWLGWTQRAVACRERVRLKQALLYHRCRLIALAIGDRLVASQRLDRPDDVFFLARQEMDQLASGHAMFPDDTRRLASDRRRRHAAFDAERPRDSFRLAEGAYLTPGTRTADPAPAGLTTSDDGLLRGASACGGQVSARAAVLRDVSEADRLRRGDVLVTRQTDPGWGPILCLVSGLVIERGGMLSHGAIIAREFGLPCVVGVAGATSRIAHGSRVAVDGDAGECRIVACPDSAIEAAS